MSREDLDEAEVAGAALIAFYLPMHTATRLAMPLIARVRRLNPAATLCAYGLYAPLNEPLLREQGVSVVLGPEAELALEDVSRALAQGTPAGAVPEASLPRLSFIVPDRTSLPSLDRYAAVQMPDGARRVTGSTESTRGCKHLCRHCPIVPIYRGQFRVVPVDVVLADIDQQVAQGAEHITFADPDFFNGPTHARRVIEGLARAHPRLTYDVTVKIEHLIRHRDLLPLLARTGCLFVTSAVESVDDRLLAILQKRHTRADFVEATRLCRQSGVALAPTFVAFTPWTTREAYQDLLTTVADLDLVEHVAPVQWALRLLVTHDSRLMEIDEVRSRVGPFDARSLTYPWLHDDRGMDALQAEAMALVGVRLTRPRAQVFDEVQRLAGLEPSRPRASRSTIPYLNEPWYC